MPMNMPGYRHLNIAQEGLSSVADSAIQFIEKSRQEAQQEKAYQQLHDFYSKDAANTPTNVQTPKQPEAPGGQAPQQLNQMQNVPQSVPAMSQNDQLLQMMQTSKVDPMQAFQTIQGMNQPQYKEIPYGGKMVRVYPDGRVEPVGENPRLPSAQNRGTGWAFRVTGQDEQGQPQYQYNQFSGSVPEGQGWMPMQAANNSFTTNTGQPQTEKGVVVQPRQNVNTKTTSTQKLQGPPSASGSGMKEPYGKLNSQQQQLVDKIGHYELDPKILANYRGSDRNMIMAGVADQYPSYNSMEYPIRSKAAADFRSPNGIAGRNVTALNTAIGHMGDLNEASKGLMNADVRLWNKIKNVGLTQTGDPRVVKFMTAATAVEGEIAKVFSGKSGTDQEITEWRNALHAAQSPQQVQAAIQTLGHLLQSRLATLNWQAEQNVGSKIPMLSPRSKTTLQKIGLDPNQFESATEQNHTLTPGDVQDGDGGVKYKFKGGDQYDKKNWEPVK